MIRMCPVRWLWLWQTVFAGQRNAGCAGDKDAAGVFTNTEDVDCEVCKGDLHLFAVVSPSCPGKATCPEHVSALECPTEAMCLLYRCWLCTRSHG